MKGFQHQKMPELLSKATFSQETHAMHRLPQNNSAACVNVSPSQQSNFANQGKRKLSKREVQTSTGRVLRLASKISQGGEANVWKVTNEEGVCTAQSLCAKIYKRRLTRVQYEKLHCLILRFRMIKQSNQELYSHLAPPIEILFNEGHQPIGYLMRLVKGKELSHYISSDILDSNSYSRSIQIGICRQIAQCVRGIHSNGIIIGDIAPQNIIVSETGFVTFVDLNSVKFTYKDRVFECDGIHIQYLSPEHIFDKNMSFIKTKSDDIWAMQMILFETLLPGCEPYNYKNNLTAEDDISQGNYFWYRKNKVIGGTEGIGYAMLTSLSERLQVAFYDSFSADGKHFTEASRMTAEEWCSVFEECII